MFSLVLYIYRHLADCNCLARQSCFEFPVSTLVYDVYVEETHSNLVWQVMTEPKPRHTKALDVFLKRQVHNLSADPSTGACTIQRKRTKNPPKATSRTSAKTSRPHTHMRTRARAIHTQRISAACRAGRRGG